MPSELHAIYVIGFCVVFTLFILYCCNPTKEKLARLDRFLYCVDKDTCDGPGSCGAYNGIPP